MFLNKNRFLIVGTGVIYRKVKERAVRKRKQRKNWFCLGCILVMLFMMTLPVFADGESDWIVDGSRLTNGVESISENSFDYIIEPVNGSGIVPFSTKYLMDGYAQISNAGDGKVTVNGKTKANTVCDLVELDIYLQYYDNGSWGHVNNWNYSVKNKSYFNASRTVSVKKGRYYRIKCYHAVTKNGVKERTSTVTDGIPIN